MRIAMPTGYYVYEVGARDGSLYPQDGAALVYLALLYQWQHEYHLAARYLSEFESGDRLAARRQDSPGQEEVPSDGGAL